MCLEDETKSVWVYTHGVDSQTKSVVLYTHVSEDD